MRNLMVNHSSWVKRTLLVLYFGLLLVIFLAPNLFIPKSTGINTSKIAYGVNVDMTAMIPGTAYTIRTAQGGNFFDLARQLGINTIRITDIRWETTGQEYSQTLWRYVFDQAEQHRIHIILLLEKGGDYSVIQQAQTLLGRFGLAGSSALWLVDLYNEPDLDDTRLMETISEEAAYVHHVAPTVPVTIGGWKSEVPGHHRQFNWQNPTDIPKFIHLVDIVSPHLYEFEHGAQLGFTPQGWTELFLNTVRKEALGKPILLEEFGAGNGLAPTTEAAATGTIEWQASVYQGVLLEVSAEYDQGVIGAVAWIITPRPAIPNPGPTDYEGDMTGWSIVLNHGQRLLPAAKEFSAVERSEL